MGSEEVGFSSVLPTFLACQHLQERAGSGGASGAASGDHLPSSFPSLSDALQECSWKREMLSPFLVYYGYSTSNTLAGFTFLKRIDYNKTDLRVLVLPS